MNEPDRPVAVFIATTGGPVQILQITEEPAVRSIVCIGRTATPLPVSDDYDHFVQPGIGRIGRLYGVPSAGAYRMDVDGAISGGLSWQAACLVAHGVCQTPGLSLAKPGTPPWLTLLLTGQVDYDGRLEPVGHIPEKIAAAESFLTHCREQGYQVIVGAPAENAETLHAALKSLMGASKTGESTDSWLKVIAAEHSDSLLQEMRRPEGRKPVKPAFRHYAIVVLIAAIGIAAALYQAGDDYGGTSPEPVAIEHPREGPPLPNTEAPSTAFPVKFTIWERRAPPEHSCAEVQFGRVEALETPVAVAGATAFAASTADALCGLGFRFEPLQQPIYIRVRYQFNTGEVLESVPRPPALSGREPFSKPVHWHFDLPYFLPDGLHYRVAIEADQKPIPDGAEPTTPAWPEMIWIHQTK